MLTAIFTGLRASELRGVRWRDLDLNRREIHVRQRADRFNGIGRERKPAAALKLGRGRCHRSATAPPPSGAYGIVEIEKASADRSICGHR
ncbi:MAG: hypothetical protein E5Y77_13970 [Mesorhizobium sp.]|nr:MAG: hypothetical protein E5Y77_13970 [Mesorhizobium sp.]